MENPSGSTTILTAPLLLWVVSPPWNHQREAVILKPASLSLLFHSATDAECVPCYSSATQINSLAPRPDSSFTQECLFCGFSSSGHAQFALHTAVGEKNSRQGSVIKAAFSSLPAFLSQSLVLVLWVILKGPWMLAQLFICSLWMKWPAWIWKGMSTIWCSWTQLFNICTWNTISQQLV